MSFALALLLAACAQVTKIGLGEAVIAERAPSIGFYPRQVAKVEKVEKVAAAARFKS